MIAHSVFSYFMLLQFRPAFVNDFTHARSTPLDAPGTEIEHEVRVLGLPRPAKKSGNMRRRRDDC